MPVCARHRYGTPGGDTSDSTFSIAFSSITFDEFLFASGDCTKWLVATKSAVIGENYENAYRTVSHSSTSSTAYSARWFNRGSPEDPWVSLGDHYSDINTANIVYGENSFSWSSHTMMLSQNNGGNVTDSFIIVQHNHGSFEMMR